MTNRNPTELADENDGLALRWAGPFGYAVLRVLRLTDQFSEADFQAFVAQAPIMSFSGGVYTPSSTLGAASGASGPGPNSIVAGHQGEGEPAPPAEFYQRVTRPGQRNSRAAVNATRRDSMGRQVRPVR